MPMNTIISTVIGAGIGFAVGMLGKKIGAP